MIQESTGLVITPMTPTEIAEYIHSEFTPYSKLSLEEGKIKLAELIQRYADWYAMGQSKQLIEDGLKWRAAQLAAKEFIPDEDYTLTKEQSSL